MRIRERIEDVEVDALIALLPEFPREHVVAEHGNLCSCAAVIIRTEVHLCGLEGVSEVIKPGGVCADPVVNALFRVGQSD